MKLRSPVSDEKLSFARVEISTHAYRHSVQQKSQASNEKKNKSDQRKVFKDQDGFLEFFVFVCEVRGFQKQVFSTCIMMYIRRLTHLCIISENI
jgi:hypothetical protein